MADTTTRTMGGTAPCLTTRVAGLCGLLFVAIVVVQNVLRGAVAPAADAEVSEIIEFATDDRAVIQVLVAMFAVAIVIMTVFVAGLYRHVADGLERIAARVGLIGWVGVAAMFSTVVVSEMSLAVAGEHLADSPGLARAFWTLNNTAFALNMAMLATALLGFSLAGAAAGITPRWFRLLGPAGAILMIVSAANGVSIAEGSPIVFVGLIGFLIWLLFVVTTGVGMIRRDLPSA